MKTLYIDCFAGIAGDMFLGAMLDMGISPDEFKKKMAGLNFHEFELDIRRVRKSGFMGTDVKVNVVHAHDHAVATPLAPELGHDHEVVHEHVHGHEHHHHVHRGLREIEQIITEAALSDTVKERSLRAFRLLAEAEGAVHGLKPEEIHFHEVGAVDSIVDIVGAFVLIEMCGIERVCASPVNVGSGTVTCAHGILPVPAPATARLLEGIPVFSKGQPMERTTPSGALLLRVLADSFGEPPQGVILSAGYGFGDRESDLPNLLRVMMYDEESQHSCPYSHGHVAVLETNIDDMNPQDYQDLEERLFKAGALDVFFTPILMKKMRPAVRLTCIALITDREKLGEIVLRYSSSIGVRWSEVNRMTLHRRLENFSSSFGNIGIKVSSWGEEVVRVTAEYEDLKRLSHETGRSVSELRSCVLTEYAKGDASK